MKIVTIIYCVALLTCASAQETKLVYKHSDPLKPGTSVTVVMLHGYGANENDLYSLGYRLPRHAEVVSLRAPVPTYNGGYCWFPLEFLPEQKFRYDYALASEASRKIAFTIRQLCRENLIDSSNIVLMGFSQGAIISYDVASKYPTLVKRVVALSGCMMEETKNIMSTQSKPTSYFIGHGLRDQVVAYSDGQKAADFLKSKKARVVFNSYICGHTITREMTRDIYTWLIAFAGD